MPSHPRQGDRPTSDIETVKPQSTSSLDARELCAIFVGGIAGSLLRAWLARRFATGDGDWPWAIFAINVSGSFVLAGVATHLQGRSLRSTVLGPLLGVGFCGAYTTFSTMQLELVQMIDRNRYALAGSYALGSVLAGLLAIWAGTLLVRRTQMAL
ncbi:MAG TPA: fluoride efflux transporter CrcB [Solirubrobacteraceae bacterium]|jgi:CrcB protein